MACISICQFNGLVFLRLDMAKWQDDSETGAAWSPNLRWSTIMTPRFQTASGGEMDKGPILWSMFWWMIVLPRKEGAHFRHGKVEGGGPASMRICLRDMVRSHLSLRVSLGEMRCTTGCHVESSGIKDHGRPWDDFPNNVAHMSKSSSPGTDPWVTPVEN